MIKKLFSTPSIGMTFGDGIVLILFGIILFLFLGCASNFAIQNPIEKIRTDAMIDKATEAYGEPGYEFEYINGRMVEYYTWWVSPTFLELATVVDSKIDDVIRVNVPPRPCKEEVKE